MYRRGADLHVSVKELKRKAWHDDDLYEVVCNLCLRKEEVLARRPSDTLIKCNCEEPTDV